MKGKVGVVGIEPTTSGFAGKQDVLLYAPVNDTFFVVTPLCPFELHPHEDTRHDSVRARTETKGISF